MTRFSFETGPGKSEVPTEIVTEEPPQLTALNEEYLDMVLTPENFGEFSEMYRAALIH